MPSYICKIGTADGRVVEKEFDSTSKEQLKENLQEQGFYVFHIKRKAFQLFTSSEKQSGRLTGRRFLSFNQELLVLLRSGLPVVQILDTLIEQMEAGGFREALNDIRDDIKSGSVLSDAFGKFPRFFPPLYVAAVKAGEKTGDLPETLARFMDYQKRVEAIRAKVKSASFYPLLLTSAAIAVVIFLMVFVVPTFTQIYADAKVELPIMTQLLIGFSKLIKGYWYLLIIALAAAVSGLRIVLSSSRGRMKIDRLMLKIPFFGPLKIEYALSGFTRTLGTTLASGTPLVAAMQMSRGTLNNMSLEKEMLQAIRRVEEGSSLSESLERTGFFPNLALRMVGVGETSGSLTEMLGDVAEYYEAEVETRLTRLTTMIEPVLMMTMGLLIAFIIVAMYVPIFQLASTVG
ncbi:type IV pilus assembly protein PilC [Malonomonas rubra DSM 5091]|uniref:Type IV pilus assembly protein PilC n=1 Tax=Malonomonas rubra DSM 5091 TaxID=1122189 RepID=A0A1M6BD25_MALRU|nr:type II secretion system F family protein [Malonomonas rubra]SHI46596.1 type IV pilus assembly protein PilC [Malonomonas rubra DSM 5091]